MAPCNGTTTTPPKLVVALRPPTIAHYNGTLQWHHDHFTKIGRHPPPPNHSTLHTTMAPCNGTTTTPPKLVVTLRPPTIAHYNGTLQWHPGATSNPPKWFVGLPPIGSKNPYSYRYLGKYVGKPLRPPGPLRRFTEIMRSRNIQPCSFTRWNAVCKDGLLRLQNQVEFLGSNFHAPSPWLEGAAPRQWLQNWVFHISLNSPRASQGPLKHLKPVPWKGQSK